MATFNTVFGSTLPSGAIDFITQDFNVTDPVQFALPISIYLVGYIPGPLILSPLSEAYGRRVIMVSSFALLTIFTVACALAPNWPSFSSSALSAASVPPAPLPLPSESLATFSLTPWFLTGPLPCTQR